MMDRNRANRLTKLRSVARDTNDDARDIRKGRPRPLGRGWRTTYPRDFPVTVTRVEEATCEPSTTTGTCQPQR